MINVWWMCCCVIWLFAEQLGEMSQMALKQITADDTSASPKIRINFKVDSPPFASETCFYSAVWRRSLCSVRALHNGSLCCALCGQQGALTPLVKRQKITPTCYTGLMWVSMQMCSENLSDLFIYREVPVCVLAVCVSTCGLNKEGAGPQKVSTSDFLEVTFYCQIL